jgi:hypothetical protein
MERCKRRLGENCIHYGLIASDIQVIKDVKLRGATAEELNVLCFEIEAAGVLLSSWVSVICVLFTRIKSGRHTPRSPLLLIRGAFYALFWGLHLRIGFNSN